MIKFTGHELDAVVVLTVDSEELVQRLLARARDRRSLRRHRGRHPAPPGGLRRADRAADRRLPGPRPADRGRRHGRGRRRDQAHLRGARGRPRELSPEHRMGFRDRGVEIKTPDQIRKMRVAGLLVGETLELLRASVRAGVTTGDLDAIAEKNIRDGGGVPSFLGYGHPPFPGDHLRVGQRRGGARHPGRPDSRGRRRHLHRLRGHRRRLARRRRDHRRGRRGPARRARADAGHRGLDVGRDRRGPPRRPGHRHLARRRVLHPLPAAPRRRCLRDPRGVHRPRHRHRDAPAAERPQLRPARARARSWSAAWRWRSSRWSRWAASTPTSTTTAGRWSATTAAGRPTSSTPSPSRPTAPGC